MHIWLHSRHLYLPIHHEIFAGATSHWESDIESLQRDAVALAYPPEFDPVPLTSGQILIRAGKDMIQMSSIASE